MSAIKSLLVVCLLLQYVPQLHAQTSDEAVAYVCTPCGNNCDKDVYQKAGSCTHCGMKLIVKNTIAFKNISIPDVCERVAVNKDIVLLDVRTEGEFNGNDRGKYGRLKNAINIPIDELKNRISELDKYKNKEIIVYCSHSKRSPRASQLLTESGFTNVNNMLGGMSEWDATKSLTCKESLLVRK